MRSQSLQVWRTKCLYLTQFGVSSRIFPTSTSPAAQHGPSGRARARGAKTTKQTRRMKRKYAPSPTDMLVEVRRCTRLPGRPRQPGLIHPARPCNRCTLAHCLQQLSEAHCRIAHCSSQRSVWHATYRAAELLAIGVPVGVCRAGAHLRDVKKFAVVVAVRAAHVWGERGVYTE